MNVFGQRIKAIRERLQMSQSEFAKYIDVSSQKVISSWELDHRTPDVDTVISICSILNVSADYLLGIDEEHSADSITTEEQFLLDDYRQLDEDGKEIVQDCTKKQLERINHRIGDENAKYLKNGMTREDLFLSPEDKDYDLLKEKMKELKKVKKKAMVSYDLLLSLLVLRGYSSHLSIYDLMTLFNGKKVPSKRFYNDMEYVISYFIPEKK